MSRRVTAAIVVAVLVSACFAPVAAAGTDDLGDTDDGSPAAREGLVSEPFAERNLRKVVPSADEFSEPTGPYDTVKAYERVDGERRLVGYAVLTSNVVDVVGFSDEPVEFLVGVDTEGTITGVQLVDQEEPFFQRQETRMRLQELGHQMVGLSATDDVVFEDPAPDEHRVDTITRATVTSEAAVETVMRSARLVAQRRDLVDPGGDDGANETATGNETGAPPGADRAELRRLAASDSLDRWNVSSGALGLTGGDPVEFYLTPVASGSVSDAVLGAERRERLRNRWSGATLVWVGAVGVPDGWGADRMTVRQRARAFETTPVGSSVRGADWSVVLVIPGERFDATAPFAVDLTVDGRTVSRTHVPAGTDPATATLARSTPDWLHEVRGPWERVWPESLLLGIGLTVVAGLLAARRRVLAGSDVSYDAIRHVVLAGSLVFIGWYQPAQPTSQQLAAFVRETVAWATGTGFDWVLFLSMPLIALVLGFTTLTVVGWGRGTFCGWICPFGALSELLYRLTPWEYELPRRYHERLQVVRYPLFLLIVGGFLVSANLGATLAKVEPFKAAFYYSLVQNPVYIAWSALLIVAGAVVFRPYCRYLCPLGAGLSFGNVLQRQEIQRYDLCGDCVKCQTDCEFQAIRDDGSVAREQCFQCSVCVENYHDPDGCPVLLGYDPDEGWETAWEDPELISQIRPADRTRKQRRILEAAESTEAAEATGSAPEGPDTAPDSEWDDDVSAWPDGTEGGEDVRAS